MNKPTTDVACWDEATKNLAINFLCGYLLSFSESL